MGQLVEESSRGVAGTWEKDLSVAAAAASAAALVWVVARLCGVDLEVRTGGGTQQVNVVSVVVVALVAGLVGGAVLRFLERRTPAAMRIWTIIALVVLAVSLLGPSGAATASAGLVLAGLHLVVGGVVIVGLRRTRAGGVA